MKLLKRFTLLAITLMFTACASTVPKKNSKPVIDPIASCDSAQNSNLNSISPKIADTHVYLAFAEQFSNATLEAQKLSLANTQQFLTANPNDLLQRFKLAMIYSLPSSNFQDYAKAQNLLQAIIPEKNLTNAQLAFANLLFDHLIAINKAEKNNRNDEKRIDNILQKNDNLQSKLDASQQKLNSTQQKLDATQLKLEAAQQKIDEATGTSAAAPS